MSNKCSKCNAEMPENTTDRVCTGCKIETKNKTVKKSRLKKRETKKERQAIVDNLRKEDGGLWG